LNEFLQFCDFVFEDGNALFVPFKSSSVRVDFIQRGFMLDSADIQNFARKRQAAMGRRSCSASHFNMVALGAERNRKKCRKS